MRLILTAALIAHGGVTALHILKPPLLHRHSTPPLHSISGAVAQTTTSQQQQLAAIEKETAEDDRAIKEIAGPALLGTLLDPFLSVVDTAWVSRLGVVSLGAVAASSEIFTLTIALSLALRESASSTIARLLAEGRTADAEAFGVKTLQLAAVGGLGIAFLVAGPSAPWCVGLMGAPLSSPLHTDALAYVRARAVALPCSMALFASEGICRGMGDTKPPLRAALIAGLLNAVLDPLMMFGPLKLGVAGAAAATGISQTVACVLLLRELASKRGGMVTGLSPGAVKGDAVSSLEEGGEEVDGDAAAKLKAAKKAGRAMLGTSGAVLLRSTAQLGCWVFVASEVSRKLGPAAIAAHGVVLKLWLLFVLAAEAPAVAGQILCARHVATGQLPRARAVLLRLLRRTLLTGFATAAALAAAAGPAASAFFPGDLAAAAGAKRLFRWAAICVPLVWPNALFESVLLGAGRSYRFLALATLLNCLLVVKCTTLLIASRPLVSSAWACITLFFVLRISCAATRIFATQRGGLGFGEKKQRASF
eukprot:CAMPEP_0171991792 /NCGR_PEP_ID=MMETSP0993-20121228/277611_1 /TAXON_ID=483369 /ORGANISM="non described non described, Strain CCMP2098" /LENGTH=534 /DNA_ID=CAMNT_0012644823 /DNA_START=110 /DNA_END=1714 /DNA_ORIENTATION=+